MEPFLFFKTQIILKLMLRIETPDSWILIRHQDHARLAGAFARHWKNENFLPPEPFVSVERAVRCHDDSWSVPDATPSLTPEGRPSAFSENLVGTYDAFEEIDLEAYLGVRGAATEEAARTDPYAAILISMHTVNLLTEQADLSGLDPDSLALHGAFIRGQRDRQKELALLAAKDPSYVPALSAENLDRAFRFLQACDSLSLFVCVAYSKEGQLRHKHPRVDGSETAIKYIPDGPNRYRLSPSPFDAAEIDFKIPARVIRQKEFASLEEFRDLYAKAEAIEVSFTITA
jgi:hypothetical protein